jgi:predicted O-methyltransferase YrrM
VDPEILERIKDRRSTDELLRGVLHLGTWENRSDSVADFWVSDRNYQYYAGIAAFVKPYSVLELGVRMGYSLISIFRGYPGVGRMVGIDIEAAFSDSQRKAGDNIRGAGYTGELHLPRADRQWVRECSSADQFDLIHIDAGHTATDVEKDILATWPLLRRGGVLIADDTDFIPAIRPGIEAARKGLSDIGKSFYFPTFRGWWVAQKVC